MSKFRHALPGLEFSSTTSMMLNYEDRDQRGLQENERDGERDLQPVLLPHRWFPKVDGAPRRQMIVADPEPLHLPPVEPWQLKSGGCHFDITSLFAAQDTIGRGGGDGHSFFHGMHRAADD